MNEKYEILHQIGSGNFSEVKKIKHKETKKEFALKVIKKKRVHGKEHLIRSEIDLHKDLKHENIVPIIEVFETGEHWAIVLGLANGGELYDRISKRKETVDVNEKDSESEGMVGLEEAEAKKIVKGILKGLEHLHSFGIVHRDLKPENVLLSSHEIQELKVWISDFGLAKKVGKSKLKTRCGSPQYVAPEILLGGGYETRADLWSLGVITYVTLSGYLPFSYEDVELLYNSILSGNFEFHPENWKNISNEAQDFVSKLLVVNPKERMTLQTALSHPWLQS